MKIKKIVLNVLFILVLAVVFVCFVFISPGDNPPDLVAPPTPVAQPTPSVDFRLLAVGDNLIHGPIYREAMQRADGSGFDFSPAYQEIVPYLQNAQLAFINQETPLGGTELGLSSYPNFNSPQELGDYLVSIGFNLISHANNHVLDKGQKGFTNTINYWMGKEKAVMAGIYPDAEAAALPPVLEVDGMRVGFLAYTYATNGISLPASSLGEIAYIDLDRILADVEKTKEFSDLVVVSMHWGVEYGKVPTEEQKQIALALANADVDLVLGHHPHVIQPVEELPQPDGGTTVVYYSLGNFISSQDRPETMLGGMALVDFSFSPDDQKLTLKSAAFVPLVTHYEGKYTDTKVIPLKNYSPELAKNHGIRQKSKSFSFEFLKNLAAETVDARYLDLE